MAHVHDTHASGTTVVESGDRAGPATALIVLIAVLLIAGLVWFLAFSGVVFDRGGDSGPDVNINRNDNPPAQQNNNTNVVPDSGTQPDPVPS